MEYVGYLRTTVSVASHGLQYLLFLRYDDHVGEFRIFFFLLFLETAEASSRGIASHFKTSNQNRGKSVSAF